MHHINLNFAKVKVPMQIYFSKDRFKFSAAHMTTFADGSKERLHGHNYYVRVNLELKENNSMVPFSAVKEPLGRLCDAWDEKVLLAKRSPFLQLLPPDETSINFSLCGKKYLFPKDEVELLEIDNVISENLVRLMLGHYTSSLPKKIMNEIKCIKLEIEESPGQGASALWPTGNSL